MNKRVKAALFAAILCFIAVEASAYRFGEVDISLRGGVSEVYDDNITYAKTSKKSDFITKPAVGFGAIYEGNITNIALSGNIYREFYAKNSNFDHDSEDFSITSETEFSKYDRLTIKDIFSHTYNPRSFEDQFGRTGGRYSSYRNRVSFGYSKDITKQFGVVLRYSNEYNDYSREDIAKSFLNSGGVESAYIINSDTSLLASYDFLRRDFDPGSKATTNALAGGIRKYITKQFYFDGIGGIDFISSYRGANYIKPYIAVSITDEIDDKTNMNLTFTRRDETISYSADLFNQWRILAGFTRQLSRRLGCGLSAFYGRGEYVDTSVVNKLIGSSVDLTYDIWDNWKGSISYDFSKEISTSASGGYRKNAVTLGLTAEF